MFLVKPLGPEVVRKVREAKPQQYNKKPVKIDQGLDVLNIWEGNQGKQQEKQLKTVKKNCNLFFYRV